MPDAVFDLAAYFLPLPDVSIYERELQGNLVYYKSFYLSPEELYIVSLTKATILCASRSH